MLWACSTTRTTENVTFPAERPWGLTASESLAFEIARASFLSDTKIPERYKDLSHYNVEVSPAGTHAYVHFIPIIEPGEKPSIGCCTKDGIEIYFEVDLPSKKVIDKVTGA